MHQARTAAVLIALCAVSVSSTASAREWTDVTGLYTLEADLIAFDDDSVILQRANKELGAFPLFKLSKQDQEYLKSKEAQETHSRNLHALQTWHMKSGLKVSARVVDYAQQDVTVQARRGKTYVNNIMFDNLPEVYQHMLPLIVEHLEKTEKIDRVGFQAWVRQLRGQAKTFSLEGVMLELENGDEYGVPFFLFSSQDQAILKSGWDHWADDKKDAKLEHVHALSLQSMAADYHRNQEEYRQNNKINRQIAVMNLNMQAIQAGLTSAWEVTLYPRPGNPNPPRWVVTLGRNSLEATQAALQQNPGFRDGPVRRISRR